MSAFRKDQPVRRHRKWRLKLFVGTIILLAIAAGTMAYWFNSNIKAIDVTDENLQEFTIVQGTGDVTISELLQERGLIKSSLAYQLYGRINSKHGQTQAGDYELSPNMSVSDIYDILTNGDVAVDLITILPAQRIGELRELFKDSGFSIAEVDEALDPAKYKDHPALADKPAYANLEGYLYPESYQYTSKTPLRAIIEASLDQMAEILTPKLKQDLKTQGLTVHEAVILASIVEEEVDNPDDKPKVAQVFLTRLERNIVLGSDVTANYGAYLQGLDESVLTDTPYNTRIYAGLPPGPVSNVSAISLHAVANPANTDYLYFVSGDDLTTYFSHTLSEHEALTSKYCTVLCQ